MRSTAPPPRSAGGTCVLLVGDREVLRATSPPDAEYALFDVADIELRASEPGRVREHGYHTTADRARKRLAQLGATADLARECARAMQPVLAEAYARGPAVRKVVRVLGPTELVRSDTYDAASRTYRGVFLDLAALVCDLALPRPEHVSATLQALYLAALLDAEPADTPVFLSTDAWTKNRKPGERTHRRPVLVAGRDVVSALAELARLEPRPDVRDHLARTEVLAFLRERGEAAPDDGARALLRALAKQVAMREMPDRGPLADATLWDLEIRLDTGELDGVVADIDALERARGKTPGTTYVRARASLALALEPPKLVAERVSALALSMTSFRELVLLAAEAWLEAGDPRRALPYARDLVESPNLDEALATRAQRLLAQIAEAAPEAMRRTFADSVPAAPLPPSRPPATPSPPPLSAPVPHSPQVFAPAQSRVPTVKGGTAASEPPTPPSDFSPPAPPRYGDDEITPARSDTHARRPSMSSSRPKPAPAEVLPSARPPPLDLELTPPPLARVTTPAASFTLDLPAPDAPQPPIEPAVSTARSVGLSSRRGAVTVETRPPPSFDPRAEPESWDGRAAPAVPIESRPMQSRRSSLPPSGRDGWEEGASMPPYRTERPAPRSPSAPFWPRVAAAQDEIAEHLSLPPGVSAEPISTSTLPRSVLEARVHFTMLARDLGLDYRLKRGIELVADASGIETMQAVLLDAFPDGAVRTAEEAHELRRHGALLSEILARRLDAEWIDISPSTLGQWAMLVPPDMRVWPFARLARFLAMRHKERDLVSYFFELSARARR